MINTKSDKKDKQDKQDKPDKQDKQDKQEKQKPSSLQVLIRNMPISYSEDFPRFENGCTNIWSLFLSMLVKHRR